MVLMTAKRFELMSDDEVIIDNCSIADDGGKQTYWIVEYGQRVKVVELLNELHEENEQLKKELSDCQKTKAKRLRRVKYQRKQLEKQQEAIWGYKGDIKQLKKENEQLKAEVTRWQILLNNYKEMVAKTLREQYHWLKNEDKILNHDKTVALLEIESIATYLGVELE